MMHIESATPPAVQILDAALSALALWTSKQISIDDFLEFHLTCPEYRRSVANLLFTYFRRKKFIDRTLRANIPKRPIPELEQLLQIAATQIIFQTGLPQQVAVSVAVDMAKMQFGDIVGGFVNAVLRKICDIPVPVDNRAVTVFPPELYKKWKKIMPRKVEELAAAFLVPAEFTCRDVGANHLDTERFTATPIKTEFTGQYRFYQVGNPAELLSSGELAAGRVYIQDPATALSISLLELNGNERVVDLCAAPGGKSLLAAERLTEQGFLLASDRSEKRQKLTEQNFRNIKPIVPYKIQAVDAMCVDGEFDVVFCDVPCSNTGVFRRRPDALWRYSERQLQELNQIQMSILEHAATLVKTGGKLVYSTCSIEPVENGNMVADFLRSHSLFTLIKQRQCYPNPYYDGAYAAVMQKN